MVYFFYDRKSNDHLDGLRKILFQPVQLLRRVLLERFRRLDVPSYYGNLHSVPSLVVLNSMLEFQMTNNCAGPWNLSGKRGKRTFMFYFPISPNVPVLH